MRAYWAGAGVPGYPWAAIRDLVGRVLATTAERITPLAVERTGMRPVPAGTLLMSFKLTIGRLAIAGCDLYTNEAIVAIVPADGVSSGYLRHFLAHQDFASATDQAVKGATLNKGKLADLRVVVPPAIEQNAIAAVLDAIDEAIERVQATIAANERLREALLHELLTRGVPGQHSEWKSVPGAGTVPACWDLAPLARATVDLRYGTSSRLTGEGSDGAHAVLRIPNVARGVADFANLKYARLSASEALTLALQPGDLLIVRTNGNPAICGESVVFDRPQGRWAFASYLLRLRTDPSVLDPTYLWTYLRSRAGRSQLSRIIRTSAGNYNLSASGLAALQVALPPVTEQRRIVDVARRQAEVLASAQVEVECLRTFSLAVADALLTGRVRLRSQVRASASGPRSQLPLTGLVR